MPNSLIFVRLFPLCIVLCAMIAYPSTGSTQSTQPAHRITSPSNPPSTVRSLPSSTAHSLSPASVRSLPTRAPATTQSTSRISPNDRWLRDLGDDDWRIRKRGILELSQRGLAVVPALIECLGDRDELRRQSATATLYRIGKPAIPLLRKALESPNQSRQHHAAFAMGLLQAPEYRVISVLFHALRSPDEHV